MKDSKPKNNGENRRDVKKIGDRVTLTYTAFENPQEVEGEIQGLTRWGLYLPLGSGGYTSYYLYEDFEENLRTKQEKLIVERKK